MVYRLEGLVRVRKEDRYGWVPSDALSADAPAAEVPTAPPPDLTLPPMPALDFPGRPSAPAKPTTP